jgi:hypothetical protein
MKWMFLLALWVGCDAAKPAPADGGTCDQLLAQIQAAAADTGCNSDGECAVLSTNNDPPVSTSCVAYVNTEGLDSALPLVAQWKNRHCGAEAPCSGGAQPACNAGTCGAHP